jgi:hypothetical protein
MDFLIRFGDGSELWLPWSWDLYQTVQYEVFCSSNPELRPLLHSAQKVKADIARLKQSVISEVTPGDVVYVDLRSYGADWYDTLDLPDKYLIKYLVEYRYLDFLEAKTRIRCHCPVFNEYFIVDRDFVQRYGNRRTIPPSSVLIDAEFCKKHSSIMPKLHLMTATNMVLESKPRIKFLARTSHL